MYVFQRKLSRNILERNVLRGLAALRGWAVLLCLLFWGAAQIPGSAQTPDTQDYGRITRVPRAEIDAWLKQEAAASGGNWNAARYHFYIGFSTGHFGQDPIYAIAMRRLAFSLMNNSLAVGDQVTPFAWEMSTWNVGKTTTLTDDFASRADFVNGVPYAPHAGSRGGHDIEQVLYEAITKTIPAGETHSAIVLLLTNSNASQAPTGEQAQLFGADNPKLAAAIAQGGFRQPLARREFTLSAGAQPITVAVTALFPQKLTAMPDAPTSQRYPTFARETWQPKADMPGNNETLVNPVQPLKREEPPKPPHGTNDNAPSPGMPGWVWIIIGLIALALIAGLLLRPRKPKPAPPKNAPEKAPPLAPPSVPIPGSLTVTIGTDTAQILTPLTLQSRWTLQRGKEGKTVLVALLPAPDAAPGATGATNSGGINAGSGSGGLQGGNAPDMPEALTLATLAFETNRVLRVEAQSGAQFLEAQNLSADAADSRAVEIEPGKRAFWRLLPPDTDTKIRLEIVYKAIEPVQKGS